jgi:ATP phosphoribosyltransferase
MEDIALLLQGVIRARGQVLLKLNVANADLEAVLGVVPSMASPTVTSLAGGAMFAVESVVAKQGINRLIPNLKSAGARDILEIPISKIID